MLFSCCIEAVYRLFRPNEARLRPPRSNPKDHPYPATLGERIGQNDRLTVRLRDLTDALRDLMLAK